MSDTQQLIGKLVEGSPSRDAVHVAVVAVEAHEELAPGTRVGFDESREVTSNVSPDAVIGVVDPFLTQVVCPGDKYWLFLLPNTITSLKHLWTHPAFTTELPSAVTGDRNASEVWLRRWTEQADCPDYDQLMAIIRGEGARSSWGESIGGTVHSDYFSIGGVDASGSIPPEFWDHVEVVTGIRQVNRPGYFSCSC